jgi:hypothetical protein
MHSLYELMIVIINNSYGRLRNLIFLFKIPMRKQKNFFEIYNLDTPSKRFVRSTLRSIYIYILHNMKTLVVQKNLKKNGESSECRVP